MPSSPQFTTLPYWRWPIGVPTTLLLYQSDTPCGRTFSPSHGSAHTSQWPRFFRGNWKRSQFSIFISLFHGIYGVCKGFRWCSTQWNVSSWGTLQSKAPFGGELQSLIYPKNRWLKIYILLWIGTSQNKANVDQSQTSSRCMQAETSIASCSGALVNAMRGQLDRSSSKFDWIEWIDYHLLLDGILLASSILLSVALDINTFFFLRRLFRFFFGLLVGVPSETVVWSCVPFGFAKIRCGFVSSWSVSFSFFFFFPCTTSNGSYFGFVLIAIALLSPSVSEACCVAITSSSSLECFVPASFPFRRVVSLDVEL